MKSDSHQSIAQITKTPGSREGIGEFDVLRSLAIVSLLLHHGGVYKFSVGNFALQNLDPYLVYFLLGSFVFISGYLMVGSFVHKMNSQITGFLKSKIARIYIPYIVALFLFILVLSVDVSRREFLVHVLGLQILLAPRASEPVLTIWFISMILVYYGLFAFLLKYFPRTRHLALAMVVVFAAGYFFRLRFDFLEYRFFYYYFVFAAGILSAHSNLLERLTTPRLLFLDKLLLLVGGVIWLGGFSGVEQGSINLAYILAINSYILAVVLFTLSVTKALINRFGSPSIFQYMAQASFFAYLFHRIIWKYMLDVYRSEYDGLTFAYLILIGGSVIFFVSYWLQKGYNAGVRSLGRFSAISEKAA